MSRSAFPSDVFANLELLMHEYLELSDLPFIRYFQEAEKWSNLYNGDVFAYLDYVRRHPPQYVYDAYKVEAALEGFDLPKCNRRAAKLRQEGNQLYVKKTYKEAVLKYNESICAALADSEDLGIAYANRSAACYEMEEFTFALANIQLARQHNYPQRLMDKLDVRERNCREQIEASDYKCWKKVMKLVLNVEVNPSIPSVAKGISMAEYPRLGRGVKAEREFKVGDVIFQERPTLVIGHPISTKHDMCNHCAAECFMSLIPCPHCVSVMYCSEECLKEGWKQCHRFECGICDKLGIVSLETYSLGPRFFFYGLTQFNDNVKSMMEYCRENARKGNNPFDLDYTKSSNAMDVFKLLHTVKVKPLSPRFDNIIRCAAAILYNTYIEHPLIKSLFVGSTEQNFLLKSFVDYMCMTTRMNINHVQDKVFHLYTLASVCNHSCDPNTQPVFRSGQMRLIVVRPIAKGDQIFVPYGFVVGELNDHQRHKLMSAMDFTCVCEVCDPKSAPKQQNQKAIRHPPGFVQQLEVVQKIFGDASCNNVDKLNAGQQFLQRYAHVHQLEVFRHTLSIYRFMLNRTFDNEMMAVLRQRALNAGQYVPK